MSSQAAPADPTYCAMSLDFNGFVIELDTEGAMPDGNAAEQVVEREAGSLGLTTRLKTVLAKYPGSTHWHFARPGERGTLEVTYWPGQSRCWISVHVNRRGAWIPEAAETMRARMAHAFRAGTGRCDR